MIISLSDLIQQYKTERMPSVDMVRQVELVVRSFSKVVNQDNVLALTKHDFFTWRDWLLEERRVTRTTWNTYHGHMRALLNFAVETDDIPLEKSPLNGVRSLPTYTKRKKLISADDSEALIKTLESPELVGFTPRWFWIAIVRTFYYTGMRRKQLAELRWGDISFGENYIVLRAESSKTRREWAIPLLPKTSKELEIVWSMTTQSLGRSPLAEEQVFNITLFNKRYKGNQLTPGQLSGAFRRLKDASDIRVSPHRFRHGYATQTATAGEIRQLQAQLGHTNVNTTYEYVSPDLEGMRRIAEALQPI